MFRFNLKFIEDKVYFLYLILFLIKVYVCNYICSLNNIVYEMLIYIIIFFFLIE